MNIYQAQKIAQHFHLGNIIANPKKVEGGLCHLMWRINTDTGDYAVKQLIAKHSEKQKRTFCSHTGLVFVMR